MAKEKNSMRFGLTISGGFASSGAMATAMTWKSWIITERERRR